MSMISPEMLTAAGGAIGAIAAAFAGGKRGGENSLNGFKDEVRERFDSIDGRLDVLVRTDGAHEARLGSIERLVDRRVRSEPVLEERRA